MGYAGADDGPPGISICPRCGVRFAGLQPRKDGFLVSFALHRRLDSQRIIKTEDYGPRWRLHFVSVRAAADLDDELRAWLQESHEVVGTQSDLRRE